MHEACKHVVRAGISYKPAVSAALIPGMGVTNTRVGKFFPDRVVVRGIT
jgi:hypothetical protein